MPVDNAVASSCAAAMVSGNARTPVASSRRLVEMTVAASPRSTSTRSVRPASRSAPGARSSPRPRPEQSQGAPRRNQSELRTARPYCRLAAPARVVEDLRVKDNLKRYLQEGRDALLWKLDGLGE